jgi:threonylcarbamoyladenosine tRNA methylthiotransferase MtaB
VRRPLASVLTLGCKLNIADSDEIAGQLERAGFQVVDSLCEADAYVINTCSVTHVADAKSRKLVRSARRLSPGAAVTVTGCFPQSAGFEAARELGADFVSGTRDRDKTALVAFLAVTAKGSAANRSPELEIRDQSPRAFVKSQEGCNDVCAFCIVPRTRGREESRTVEEVARRVEEAVAAGAKEAVITGTQLGAWGRDLSPPLKPHHLIGGVLERTEVARLRFSSLQPQDITPELLALWQDPRVMPHFHLALQSGSERTLATMRRRYTARDFLLAAERIHAAVPAVAITTDVIAGFPGETDEDFEATLALCREVGFSRLHCFPYSQRTGTTANRMPAQLSPEVKKERMARLLALGEELSLAFRRSQEGTTRPVLWESRRPAESTAPEGAETWYGHTDNYIPVYANAREAAGRVTPAQLGRVYHDGMWGSIPQEAV